MTPVKIWLGYPYPLGATWMGNGVNFAIFSESATSVDLCLFDRVESTQENIRIPMTEHTDQVWHLFLPDVQPGQLYGYRVYGPYDPERGMRFNSSKLLLDPYAKAIAGTINWSDEMFGYVVGAEAGDLTRDFRDDAWGMAKGVVIDPAFDWADDKSPRTPLNKSVIYEVHVKGFTRLMPDVPAELRGTYAGLGSATAIKYLTELGVTAVELLPVHEFVNDKILVDKGLTNYWGYNSLGYFAPEAKYSSSGGTGGQVSEFKSMVRNLHAAGIEVILDVVYNHTGEGSHMGPTLSFRGIDNQAYYWLSPEDPRFYMDFTGTGNTFNLLHPRTLQLVMDSLRYWVLEMHVDGFRFDLASTLARDFGGVNKLHAFFEIIHQDPVLSQVKLIAEPWDVGDGGYQVGNFPVLWAEWNGKYRDAVRSFWKGDESRIGEMAYRLTGSPDLYQHNGRRPYASINFITAHDGFTLNDLVSYNKKHNEANGEKNHDGDNNNHSWNHGVEGPTDDPDINALRAQQRRNLLTTLLLSQGVPMICAGDEWARTQQGNNNAYCQDNEISWLNWEHDAEQEKLLAFTKKLIQLRAEHPVFRRPKFFQGRRIRGSEIKDVMWFNPGGNEMSEEEWNSPFVRCLGMLLSGDTIDVLSFEGEPIRDKTFLLLINAHHETIPFVLPGEEALEWRLVMDTADEEGFIEDGDKFASGDDFPVDGRSTKLLRLTAGSQAKARHESWKKRQVEVPRSGLPGEIPPRHVPRGLEKRRRRRLEKNGEQCSKEVAGMIRAAIFDLDGTLVDSNDLHTEAWDETFRHFGKEIPYHELRHQIGKGGDQYLPVFLSASEQREIGKEVEKFRADLFKKKYLERVRPFPRVRELLQRVRDDGKRVALASSGNETEIEHYVKLAEIGELIDSQTTKSDVRNSKPCPDVFLGALNLLKVGADEAIVIGDTPYDIQAAKKLGLPTIALLCGGFSEDELRASGAVSIFRDPADLLVGYQRSPLCG